MIVYELQCVANHRFEGWFASSNEFETQSTSGEISCPVCGATELRRLPCAAHLSTGGGIGKQNTRTDGQANVEVALKKLVEYVRDHYEDVGEAFPEEARRIHYGESDARNIRGVATVKDFAELVEEGVAVAPLPVSDRDKLN